MTALKGVSLLGMLGLGFLLSACLENGGRQKNGELQMGFSVYAETRKDEVIDHYFDTPVTDPYRWLHDDMRLETGACAATQNSVTFVYLSKIPHREAVRHRLQFLRYDEQFMPPFHVGVYTHFYVNTPLQTQYAVYLYHANDEPASP